MRHVKTPTHFGDASLAPIGPADRQVGASPIEFRTTFINNTNLPITVEWRSGLKVTLPPTPSFDCRKLIVRIEVTVHHSVKLDIQRLLSSVDEQSTPELKAMKEAFVRTALGNKYGGAVFILDYPVEVDTLRKAGGSIYYHEVDTVVSLLSYHDCPSHPYGEAGRNIQLVEAHSELFGDQSFNYAVELVDNTGKYGDRFLNIGNKVYHVHAKQDSTRRDGIYIITHTPVDSSVDLSEKEVQHYPFEGAEDKLGLFRSAEEALNLGDMSLARRQEILNLEHTASISKAELTLVKQTHEREMADKERDLKLLEMDRENQERLISEMRAAEEHRLKMERERTKDFYEDKSYERKNDNEVLRFLPAVIVGIGAVFMAFKSIFGGGK